MNVAILTEKNGWYQQFARKLAEELGGCPIYSDHEKIIDSHDVLFILNYGKLVPRGILNKNSHNIVVHESDLPNGKGWAPLFWQVLEGKNEIVFTLFEASEEVDSGDIYLKKTLSLTGFELNGELREKQASLTHSMCEEFLNMYHTKLIPMKKNELTGEEEVYRRRWPKDSEVDINKSLSQQFNLLRTVSNTDYPAYFELDGHKYILYIEEKKDN